MTPDQFRTLAETIAGPLWRSRLGPLIGVSRVTVHQYANGQNIPQAMQIALRCLAEHERTD